MLDYDNHLYRQAVLLDATILQQHESRMHRKTSGITVINIDFPKISRSEIFPFRTTKSEISCRDAKSEDQK